MALLETSSLLHQRGGDAIVVLADEPVPVPLGSPGSFPPAAVAFHVRADPERPARARLGPVRRGPGGLPNVPGGLDAHPCAAAFRLAFAVSRGTPGAVSLGTGGADGWAIDIEVVE